MTRSTTRRSAVLAAIALLLTAGAAACGQARPEPLEVTYYYLPG